MPPATPCATCWALTADASPKITSAKGPERSGPFSCAGLIGGETLGLAGEEGCAAMTTTNLDDLPEKSPFPGWRGKFIRSAGMTFVYWDVPAGTVLPEHSHPHEQVAHTFEGEFEIVVAGIKQVLRPGSVTIIPPHAVHSGRAITDCRILDVFCPVREDYIQFEG